MLIDSNIIIYAAKPENNFLRQFIANHSPFVSAISYLEVVGYHDLKEFDRHYFEEFFHQAGVLPIYQMVLDTAVSLRQLKKMSLGDSLIAGTAITHNLTLVTNNTVDFRWIDSLTVFNPFDRNQSNK